MRPVAERVFAIRRGNQLLHGNLKIQQLKAEDLLLVHGPATRIEVMVNDPHFSGQQLLDLARLKAEFPLDQRLHQLLVPAASRLVGLTLSESRLGDDVEGVQDALPRETRAAN